MTKIPKDYSRVFDVFSDRPLNKRQKFFITIGTTAFTVYFFAEVAFYLFISGRYGNNDIPAIYNQFIIMPAAWGFLIGFLMIGAVAIEYVGYSFGRNTFWSSLLLILGKVFKYIVLPTIIIVAVLSPIIIASYYTQ